MVRGARCAAAAADFGALRRSMPMSITITTTPASPNSTPATVCIRLARESRFSIGAEHGPPALRECRKCRRARARSGAPRRAAASTTDRVPGRCRHRRPCSRCDRKSRAAESRRRCRTHPRRSAAAGSRYWKKRLPGVTRSPACVPPSTSNGGSCTTVGSSFEKSATTLLASVSTTAQVSVRPNDSPVRTALVDVRHQQVIGSTSTMSTGPGAWDLGLGLSRYRNRNQRE